MHSYGMGPCVRATAAGTLCLAESSTHLGGAGPHLDPSPDPSPEVIARPSFTMIWRGAQWRRGPVGVVVLETQDED